MTFRLPQTNLAAASVAAILFASEALAGGFSEGGNGNTAPGSSTQAGAQVVATCGAQSWSAGTLQPNTQDTAGNPCPPVSAPLATGGATSAKQDTTNTDLGPPGATACATDNGSCSLNALIERTNQRITSLITALGSPFQAAGALGAGTATIGGIYPVPQSGSGNAIAPVVSGTAETAHQIKGSAGNLYGFSVTTGATAGYALVLNSTSDPGNGAVTPKICLQVPANSTVGWDSGTVPSSFATGIEIVFSSTGCFTETQSATAFISGIAQ